MSDRSLPDILTEDEDKALLATFNKRYITAERNRLMILLALETGARVGDLINLKWSDIDKASYRVHLKNGKGGKDRIVWIRPEVLADLEALADRISDHTGLVFKTIKGGPVQAQYLRRMIGAQARKAGIEKRVHFHLLRHTYLTRLYSQTKNIRLVQEVAGHANIATTMIYTHVSGEDIREAMIGSDPTPDPPDEIPEKKATKADVKRTLKKTQRTAAASKKKLYDDDGMLLVDEEDDKKTAEALRRMK